MNKYVRHMLVFSHVVEAGSVSAAAARLKLSKSVISQQLKALEQELGVSLLNRNTRSQVLTSAGQDFYEQCQKINGIITDAWGSARESQKLALGTIRVSAPNALIEPFVAPALGRLVEHNDGITPTLLSDDNRAHLIRDEIDLAIRVGKMQSSEFKQRKLGSFRDVLCASPGYLDKHDITPKWLLEHQGKRVDVNYVANSWQGSHIKHKLTQVESGKSIKLIFNPNRLCNSLPAVVQMCRAGCGFAYIPDFVFNRYQDTQELVSVLPGYVCDSASIYAVHAYSGTPPTLVRLAIDAIRDTITEVMESQRLDE